MLIKFKILVYIIIITTLVGCNGCSKSAQKLNRTGSERNDTSRSNNRRSNSDTKTVIKMQKKNGVYTIPVELNGQKMSFIFDTGASIISISEKEADLLMADGTLTEDDIKGTASFRDANGDISEGTLVNIKTVKIGDIILKDIEASIVHNTKAPLLLGQSALENFRKVSVDYGRGELTLE